MLRTAVHPIAQRPPQVLLAFATVSVSAPEPYVRPVLLGPDAPRTLILEGARHPCVERMESSGGGVRQQPTSKAVRSRRT
eukprot:scaffold330238_cov59-Tisochrysis_lutea.AAC.7